MPNLILRRDDPGIKQFIRRLEEKDGSEQDLLDFAKQVLKDADYQHLEQAIERGYEKELTRWSIATFSKPYLEWCRAFGRTCINVTHFGKIRMQVWSGIATSDQVRELEGVGWVGVRVTIDPVYMYLPENTYSGATETCIQQTLEVLKLPFHRSLPQVKNRYERLMGEGVL